MTTKLIVEGMTCGHCQASVERALQVVPGVEEVRVDLESKTAQVEHSTPVDEAALREAIESAGYSVVGVQR